MDKHNENDKPGNLSQILPDKYTRKVVFVKSTCVKVSKRLTGGLIKWLSEQGVRLEKVAMSAKNFQEKQVNDFAFGKLQTMKDYLKLNDEYYSVDLSFLKRVKSFDEGSNLVLVSSNDVMSSLKVSMSSL
jgi:hypothetical protein